MNRNIYGHGEVELGFDLAKTAFICSMKPLNSAWSLEQRNRTFVNSFT